MLFVLNECKHTDLTDMVKSTVQDPKPEGKTHPSTSLKVYVVLQLVTKKVHIKSLNLSNHRLVCARARAAPGSILVSAESKPGFVEASPPRPCFLS